TVVPGSPRTVDNVLRSESNLMRVVSLSNSKPALTDDKVKKALQAIVTKGEAQGASEAEKKAADEAKKQIALLSAPFKVTDTFRYVTVADTDKGEDGSALDDNDITEGNGLQDNKRGLFALDKADLFNLLCIPADSRDGDTSKTVYGRAMTYCVERRA